MHFEWLITALVLCTGLLPVLCVLCRGRSGRFVLGAIAGWLLVGIALPWVVAGSRTPTVREHEITNRPIQVDGDSYVSSNACRACHPQQYDLWHASYHRTMTQIATPQSVVGEFDQTVSLAGWTLHLERRDDEFWVQMQHAHRLDDTGKPAQLERRIVMTTGSHHMQVYWYATGERRNLGLLPFIYLFEDQRWIPRGAAFLQPPGLTLEEDGRWNQSCIICHTTHGRTRMDRQPPNQMDSRVAEFGISCQACHGPGETHVRINRDPRRRYDLHFSDKRDPTIFQPQHAETHISADSCGQCHSIWVNYSVQDFWHANEHGKSYRPGDDLNASQLVVQLAKVQTEPMLEWILKDDPRFMDDRFWSDGMVRVSGREHNGLLETPCFQRGPMTCLSCHSMHQQSIDARPIKEWANDQLKVGMNTDEACLQCHESLRTNIQQHTYHEAQSSGSRCYNCHMPHTTYGLLKAIRSHTVNSPRVQESLETGRPNACNLCHLDRSLAWSAEHLDAWYGIPQPPLSPDERSIAASLLWLLRGDAGQRALIAWGMGWQPAQEASGRHWQAPFLAVLLNDPYDAVRFIAKRSLRTFEGFKDFKYDFLDPAEGLAAARRLVTQIWQRDIESGAKTWSEQALIDADGQLRQDIIGRLLRERDNTPIDLKE